MAAAGEHGISVLSLNAALQDVRLLGRSVWRPLDHVDERLDALGEVLREGAFDLVCLQECFHRPLQDRLVAALGERYPHIAGLAPRGPKLRLGSELLVLSRHPIEDARFVRFEVAQPEERLFSSMGFVVAGVRLPGVGVVDVVNLHASAGGLVGGDPQSARSIALRSRQIAQILQTVPGPGPVLVAGDLNAGPGASEACYRQVLAAGFEDAFAAAGGGGASWDLRNPLVGADGEDPQFTQRIDHVFVNRAARAALRPAAARIAFDEALVVLRDGRRVPVSDHYGVEVVFEL